MFPDRKIVDDCIKEYIIGECELGSGSSIPNFKEMAEYCLFSGKALRPLIVFDIYKSLSGLNSDESNMEVIGNLMVSIELLHTASLLLDDLPCMDNDVTRRGQQCFHIKYSILDAKRLSNKFIMDSLKLVYRHLSIFPDLLPLVIDLIQNTAVGQFIDLFKNIETKLGTHKKCELLCLKTSTLFSISFLYGYLGFIIVNGKNDTDDKTRVLIECNRFIEIGKTFGKLYQISDDFTDYNEDKLKGRTMNNVIALGYSKSTDLFYSLLTQFKRDTTNVYCFNDFFANLSEKMSQRMNNGLIEILQ
jgi:geranylgeranyl pyrophosphate synthase